VQSQKLVSENPQGVLASAQFQHLALCLEVGVVG
jgi:hypothetical protein